jgi:peptidoglycan LD-endopeptidase LytH
MASRTGHGPGSPRGAGLERRSGDTWHERCSTTLVVAALLAGLAAVTATPGSALATPDADAIPAADRGDAPPRDDVDGDEEEDEPAPTPEELAHERALEDLAAARRDVRSAQAAVRAARSGGNSTDGALRRSEEALVPSILGHLDAETRVATAETALRTSEQRVRRAEARLTSLRERADALDLDLEVARLELEARVVRAYKTGSLAYETSLPLTVIREAGSPSELATAIKHLSTLMAVGLDQVEALVDEVVATAAWIDEAETELDQARTAVADARETLAAAEADREQAAGEVAGTEARAAALRVAANEAEGRLLAAITAARATERALAASYEEAVAAAAATDAPRPDLDVDGVDPDEEADEQDAGWDGRARALARARSLPAEDRRTATDWVCPVEGARFINDWGFPRSNQRRHEGTDVFAPLGTPVVAPTDAVVEKLDAVDRFDGRRDLGGITVWLEHDRHRYYLAHLHAIHPDVEVGAEVAAGTVVGFVGRSGNARGTPPHLHLGWYVDQVAVNPYASLAVACSPERPPLDAGEGSDGLGAAS